MVAGWFPRSGHVRTTTWATGITVIGQLEAISWNNSRDLRARSMNFQLLLLPIAKHFVTFERRKQVDAVIDVRLQTKLDRWHPNLRGSLAHPV